MCVAFTSLNGILSFARKYCRKSNFMARKSRKSYLGSYIFSVYYFVFVYPDELRKLNFKLNLESTKLKVLP